jgi:glyceraldehyde 3-phosphate dehydrogenase
MPQPIKIGINGFGRIGRKVARLALTHPELGVEIVGINDLSNPEMMAHLLKYDSVHGTLKEDVRLEGDTLHVGHNKIKLSAQKDPAALPWGQLGASFVHECTGAFTDREKAALHLKGGAKKVIISAPSKDPDATLCLGVNEGTYDPAKHVVVSNASCTTNCLAPLIKVLDDNFGVVRGTQLKPWVWCFRISREKSTDSRFAFRRRTFRWSISAASSKPPPRKKTSMPLSKKRPRLR